MTIVLFFDDPGVGALARERIGALAAKHPSRVIVLDATGGRASRRAESDDWIELDIAGADAQVVADAIATRRLADSPVVLLWVAAGIGDDARFCALCREAQTVVYNSSLVSQGLEALRAFVAYAAGHPELALADIAYLRLAPWQESLAAFFDGEHVEELTEIRRVEIACGSEPEAFYLLGWLAGRLGWDAASAGAVADRAGRSIEFAIVNEGEPRRVRRVALVCAQSRFVAQVDERGDTISLCVEGGDRSQRYRAVNNPGIAALVERAILASGHDRVFVESLVAAGAILARQKEKQ